MLYSEFNNRVREIREKYRLNMLRQFSLNTKNSTLLMVVNKSNLYVSDRGRLVNGAFCGGQLIRIDMESDCEQEERIVSYEIPFIFFNKYTKSVASLCPMCFLNENLILFPEVTPDMAVIVAVNANSGMKEIYLDIPEINNLFKIDCIKLLGEKLVIIDPYAQTVVMFHLKNKNVICRQFGSDYIFPSAVERWDDKKVLLAFWQEETPQALLSKHSTSIMSDSKFVLWDMEDNVIENCSSDFKSHFAIQDMVRIGDYYYVAARTEIHKLDKDLKTVFKGDVREYFKCDNSELDHAGLIKLTKGRQQELLISWGEQKKILVLNV